MLFNYDQTPKKLAYYAEQNVLLKRFLKAGSSNETNFSYYTTGEPELFMNLNNTFDIFKSFKFERQRVFCVPLEFDIYKTPILGNLYDLDYNKLLINKGHQELSLQFVKRNVFLKNCNEHYSIVDDDVDWALLETPSGLKTFEKIYLIPTYRHPRDSFIRLAPLQDLEGNVFCVRHSYCGNPFKVKPKTYMRFGDISENLYYNVDCDSLCDASHHESYQEMYPEWIPYDMEDEDDDDEWIY